MFDFPLKSRGHVPNKLVIISGPSGSGKTTIVNALIGESPGLFGKVVTATTRDMRDGEVYGVDYTFYRRDMFGQMIREGKFLEHAEVHGNLYGTPLSAVNQALMTHSFSLLPIDVQGHAAIRKSNHPSLPKDCIVSFMISVNIDMLRDRLEARGTKTGEIDRRLSVAQAELDRSGEFDYVVWNYQSQLAETIATIREFLRVR